MNPWPKHPVIYEINTWVWLNELSRKHGAAITLPSVLDEEWDAIDALGIDAVWLMGVWERSPAGIRIAMRNEALVTSFRQAPLRPAARRKESSGCPGVMFVIRASHLKIFFQAHATTGREAR